MARETKIQWCDSTVNPVMGCAGCELWIGNNRTCYAGAMHQHRSTHKGYAPNFDVPKKFPGRMAKAAKWSDLKGQIRPDKPWLSEMPRLIFVSDMGDAFSHTIDFAYLESEVLKIARTNPQHQWMWLSKRPTAMAKFSRERGWSDNMWAMTSVTGKASQSRVDLLKEVDGAKILGVSFEPLWDEPDWSIIDGLDWVIFGGESGSYNKVHQFDTRWVKNGLEHCAKYGVKAFVKQLGRRPGSYSEGKFVPLTQKDSHGGDWSEWPKDLCFREMPIIA